MKARILTISILLVAHVLFAQAKKITADDRYIQETKKLAKNSLVINAFAEIDRLNPVTIAELITLNEIAAPPFKETERAKKFQQMLTEAGGVKVWIDSIGNVLALRKGVKGGRVVAIDGHLDTVFPEGTDVTVKRKGDTLYAPGIGDNARGLMVVLTVLRAMEKAKIKTNDDVLFVGSVGEEGMGDLRGVKYLFGKSGVKIDAWISIDDYGISNVNNSGTGSLRYRVTVKGSGGHSWIDFGLGNPHHALAKIIHYYTDAATDFTAKAKAKTTFNVGRMGGGTSVNAIPFESWMEVDMRSEDVAGLRTIDSIFNASVYKGLEQYNKTIGQGPPLTVNIEQVGFRPSGTLDAKTPLIQRSLAAVQYMGYAPALKMMSGNANIPIAKGIPAVTLGWGGVGEHAHALNEWWLDHNGTDAIKLALLTLLGEAGISKK